jgi:hypothetical protein
MKQLSFASGEIKEEDIKEKQPEHKIWNVTPKILSYPIKKCKFKKEGCIFAGDKNICLLTNKEEERCPR